VGYNVLLVPDQVYQAVKTPVKEKTYIGYKVENWQATGKLGQALEETIASRDEGVTFTSYAFQLKKARLVNGVMLFIGVLVGAVFFIAAGSFLYFRLYTDLEYDKRQYRAITKVGLAEKELHKIVTTQLVILFFAPIAVAIVHSVFAFVALQSLLYYSIAATAICVLGCFLVFQVLYFLLIRSRYLRHLKEAVL
jgi:putative ABC transport system permease protein